MVTKETAGDQDNVQHLTTPNQWGKLHHITQNSNKVTTVTKPTTMMTAAYRVS